MKKIFPSLFLLIVVFAYSTQAQQTKQILKKTVISHFYTCTLDQMLDSLSMQYKLPIFYEKDAIKGMDVNNRFFNESLRDVLKFVCNENGLQYWVENDGTIYILQKPDDLAHLKHLKNFSKDINRSLIKAAPLEEPKGPPKHFDFAVIGRVTDQNTGESLPGATVKVRNTQINTQTNISGNFTLLDVPSDTVALEVSFVGYQPDAFRLTPQNINSTLTLSLFPSMNALTEVNINGKKTGVLNTDSKRVSVLQLAPSALDKLPNIGERDVMRAFQLMPGISATNESSSGAYVRGGTPDQNLVTFDGFTVYQVDHLYGFFSAFNSNAVRDVELYKGGFSSKYGGRLSAVTVITGKDGNKNETNIGGDISLLSTNVYAETPIGKNSSLLVAARRSYQGPLYDKIFGQFNTATVNNAPPAGGPGGGRRPGGGMGGFNQVTPSSSFYDLNAKYVFTPSKQNTFALSVYNGADDLNNSRDMTLPPFNSTSSTSSLTINDNSKSGNTGASLKWTSIIGRKLFANTLLSYSEFFSDRNRGTSGTVSDSGITTKFSNGILEHNLLRDISLKSDWEYQATSKVKLIYGGYGSLLHIQYAYTQNDTSKLINQDNRGAISGGYAELEVDPTTKLHLQPGLRATYFSPTRKAYLEPRLSGTYQLTKEFNFKGAVGTFYQYSNQVVREDIVGGDKNFWVLANQSNIPVSRADHYIAGFNYETDNFLFNVEGYYKNLTGLTEYSIRQTGGTAGRGGPFGGGGTAATLTQNFYSGVGYAKGIEFLLQKKSGSYTGWLSYTLGEAKSKFDAYGTDYFSSNQDITHEFKSINMYHLQRWSFSAVFIASTGHPYTAPLGSYTLTGLDGSKTTFLSISQKNGERLPAYHRLDLSATYDILKFDGIKTGSIGLSLFNVYNHVNTWYNEYYIQNNQVVTTTVKYLGFTPNITLSLKWK